jgi:alkylated DNA repair dioxygenase AlkB
MDFRKKEYSLSKNNNATFVVLKDLGDFSLNKNQFEQLWAQRPKERGTVTVYGKQFDMPRWCKSYGESYFFSGENHNADSIDSILIDGKPFLTRCIEAIKQFYPDKVSPNQCLINWYDTLQSYISDHSDDEKNFVKNTPVICFNYCLHPRDIIIKKIYYDDNGKKKSKRKLKYLMKNNKGYIMQGSDFQKFYTHGVPKRASKEWRDERRISLTFRLFKQ